MATASSYYISYAMKQNTVILKGLSYGSDALEYIYKTADDAMVEAAQRFPDLKDKVSETLDESINMIATSAEAVFNYFTDDNEP